MTLEHETAMDHDDAWSKLDAYLDGELPATERWAVATHLQDCADCRQYVANRARLRQIVRDQVMSIQTPPELNDRLRAALAKEEKAAKPVRSIAWLPPQTLRAAALLGPLVVGLLVLRLMLPYSVAAPALQSELVVAHALFAQDTSKLDVAGNADAVAAWFRDKANLSVTVPEIAGYRLAGGRLIVVAGQPVAQIVYRSIPDGLYLSLLRFEDHGTSMSGMQQSNGFAVGQQGPTAIVTWASGDDRTVLIGEAPLAGLRQLAEGLAIRLGPLPTVAPVEIRMLPGMNGGDSSGDYPR